MKSETIETCSPYLNRTRRSLPEACRDIAHRHRKRPPCGACSLVALCRGTDRRPALAEARRRVLAGEDRGLAHWPLVRPHHPEPSGPEPLERGGRHAA